jgi:hypothetical protein
MGTAHWALLVGTLTLAGCGGGDRPQPIRNTGGMMGHTDSGGMGMGRMTMPGMQMMPGMRAHMDSMRRMSPQQMQGMMATHQSMMSQMLDGMGSDMRGMNMPAGQEWTALSDSVKQDLADLPGLHGQELSTRMGAHADRVQRLMGMHEQMIRE